MTTALDGNAAAGVLSEVFAADVTVAVATCRGCGDRRPVGALQAYLDAPGVVLRCVGCEGVLIRLVRGPTRAWLDLAGVATLQVDLS